MLARLSVAFIFLCSCAPQKPVFFPGYEPVTIERKGDIETNLSVRPFRMAKMVITGAPAKFMAIRAGYVVKPGIQVLDFSIPLVFELSDYLKLITGPSYMHQTNKSEGRFGGQMISWGGKYRNDAEFQSPGLLVGLHMTIDDEMSHQLIVRSSYNIIDRYTAEIAKENRSQSSYGIRWYDLEYFSPGNIPNFMSFEFNYHFLLSVTRNVFFKASANVNYCQPTFKHEYEFEDNIEGFKSTVSRSRMHPTYALFGFGAGIVVRISTVRNPADAE